MSYKRSPDQEAECLGLTWLPPLRLLIHFPLSEK